MTHHSTTILYILTPFHRPAVFCPGAIEIATTCARGAKRIAELARDDSDNDGEVTASSAYAAAQKKVRVSGTTADGDPSEINLKMPSKASGPDDSEELHAILFGGEARGSRDKEKACSDEEQKQEKKRRVQQRNISKGNRVQPAVAAGNGADGDSQSAEAATSSWAGMSIGTSKKAASESKELDKAESLILTVSQLKGQIQDESSVLQVSLKAVRSLAEKVSTRLSQDGTNFFVEAVRRSGSNSRAAQVWQNMKDSKACLETCTC